MRVFEIAREIWLPKPRETVFEFFADARNLQQLTPPWLDFRILTPGPIELRPGAVIDYRLRVHGLPLAWQSEISVWEPPLRFVDVQRRGPYRLWRHTHTFTARHGGTLVGDQVRYAVPGGWLVHELLVKRDVAAIFDFREAALRARFDAPPPVLPGPHAVSALPPAG